ncbi:EDD domain protein, DegV family [Fervidobacterium pennivorans DSM 9078]|uniref:EDD domain protein, DegV family n=1 Tax=Fervidobacterium pennivorans (strain DSM 9078 / Ven5) TaxID=771875 RepID=H9UBW1_FERPD|nr:DegV family protein [Fervidobacterium pennivorans]AFG35004.1 EDD domain protein, DegV family [Fervidobacterium pennivorans DSM 9078]
MVTFITDSGCDLPAGINLPFELKILPLRVYGRNEEYEDKVTLNPEELYRIELQGEVATTSLPKPKAVERVLKEASESSEKVYVITISSKLSNTYDIVQSVVSSLGAKNIVVLDSKTASIKQGYVLLKAMELVRKNGNLTQKDIDKAVENSQLVFFVPTLEYLYRGGRIGKAKAFFGKLLNIKPILTTDNEGEVNTLGTVRTLESGVSSMAKIAQDFVNQKGIARHYSIIGGFTIESMKNYLDKLIANFDEKAVLGISNIGAAIAAHVGPEAFGMVIGEKVEI